MRSIVDTLKAGSGKERLAVISDIVSILGVSLATVLGGAFALKAKLDVENILGVVISGLLSVAGALVVIALFLGVASRIGSRFSANSPIRKLLICSLWLLFSGFFVYAVYFSYIVLTSIRFVSP